MESGNKRHRRRASSGSKDWIPITARKPGRCDLCGRQFAQGNRIRYHPSTYCVRCLNECQALQEVAETPAQPKPDPPKRVRARPVWAGEYVLLYDRGDYTFRKCVVCGRDFERAAGRVAQAKKRGVCPACERSREEVEVDRLKEAALAHDRDEYRRGHPSH